MSFNFNDPAGVQALLDQIRSSQAWQELSAASTPSQTHKPTSTLKETQGKDADGLSENDSSPPSVAALLSQLEYTSKIPPSPPTNSSNNAKIVTGHSQEDVPLPALPSTSLITGQAVQPSLQKDLRWLDFNDSIHILLPLSRQQSFLEEMNKIKRDQDALERRLWEERRSIHKKYEDRLQTANAKASIIGCTISKHEAEMLVAAHKQELRKFDKERAIPAWDSLVAQQQLKLQRLRVPTMHVTSDPSVRELQQRVLQVLTSIIGPTIK